MIDNRCNKLLRSVVERCQITWRRAFPFSKRKIAPSRKFTKCSLFVIAVSHAIAFRCSSSSRICIAGEYSSSCILFLKEASMQYSFLNRIQAFMVFSLSACARCQYFNADINKNNAQFIRETTE